MTVDLMERKTMQQMAQRALGTLNDGRFADICGELRQLLEVLGRDVEDQGWCILAREEEIEPLLLPYLRALSWDRPLAALVAVSGSTSVSVNQLFGQVRRSCPRCVLLPVPLPSLKEPVLVALIPLNRRAGDIFQLDYTVRALGRLRRPFSKSK